MNEPEKKTEYEDDGRTIADMNVDGMPWYIRGRGPAAEEKECGAGMTKEETRAYTWAAIRSGLLILLVFAAVFFLFLLFCDYVWFR